MAGRASSPEQRAHVLRLARRHDHERVGVRLARGGQHPAQDRTAAQGVQHLRRGFERMRVPMPPAMTTQASGREGVAVVGSIVASPARAGGSG